LISGFHFPFKVPPQRNFKYVFLFCKNHLLGGHMMKMVQYILIAVIVIVNIK
jgi:hypothetical protein